MDRELEEGHGGDRDLQQFPHARVSPVRGERPEAVTPGAKE
jgi:hypothetical protein